MNIAAMSLRTFSMNKHSATTRRNSSENMAGVFCAAAIVLTLVGLLLLPMSAQAQTDGMQVQTGRTVNNSWSWLPRNVEGATATFAQTVSYKADDPGLVRVAGSQMIYQIQDRRHGTGTHEDVDVLSIMGDFDDLGIKGEVGTVTMTAQRTTMIRFEKYYNNPVIFTQVSSFNVRHPVAVIPQTLRGFGATLRMYEPSTNDGYHPEESVSYMVLEAGTQVTAQGTKLMVGNATVVTVDHGRYDFTHVDLPAAMAADSAVILGVQSSSQEAYLGARAGKSIEDGELTGVNMRFMRDRAREASRHTAPTHGSIGYLIVEQPVVEDESLDLSAAE